jgi:hypothetical protein
VYRQQADRDDPDVRLILAAWKRSSARFRGAVPMFGALAALMLGAGLARGEVELAVVGAIFFLLLAVFGRYVANKTERSPAVVALSQCPGEVVSVRYYETSDSRGIFRTKWLEVRTASAHVALKVDDDLDPLVQALARRCPNASLNVPGLKRPAGQTKEL